MKDHLLMTKIIDWDINKQLKKINNINLQQQ